MRPGALPLLPAPEPSPEVSEPAVEDTADEGPGNSGSAPGRTKPPKAP